MITETNTVSIIVILVGIVIGSGGGGLIGAIIIVRRFQLEKSRTQVVNQVDLQAVDVEQFKAMFPGGLGEAVEHWRDEARGLYVEVDQLRDQRGIDHDQILTLQSELRTTRRELSQTKRNLERANDRITQLESQRK